MPTDPAPARRDLLWLREPLAVLTGDDAADRDAAAAGGVVVDTAAGTVVELVPAGGTPAAGPCTVLDAREHVLLPGLINTHHHFFQTLTRAWAPVVDVPLFPWLTRLYPVWARLTPEDLRLATTAAMAELLLSGCTTAADHHYLFPDGMEHSVDVQVEAARALGMRAVLTRGSMSLGRRDGGLPPQETVQEAGTILADSARLVAAHHERGPGARIQIALAPCSPFSVTREIMRDTAVLAQELDVRLHTHLAETVDEEQFCRERFGLRTVDYLESTGWLTERTWLAHGIHFDDDEVARLGAAGVGVAHCPSSNMRLASGTCRALELEDAGAPVGLGVDGSASNDASNLLLEARQALYVQRLRYGAQVGVRQALGWATRGSARLLGREDLGVLRPGAQADLAMFRLDGLRFSGAHDPLSALLLCGADRADRVMVGGRWLVTDGRIEGLDLEELIAAHTAAARRLVG
ncbi:8-oxoguanine deaminase [Kocuria flava]|uniref:8-oxoguanine deaminase n=1 Tax=Kocuria flava TaxID=446860 RepID=A0A2N4T198_9MICC|nr:8-oxoguanine deaminase [Kocuria flava]PLC12000.1 8-oxoguanine deaminase [Kocuria flava]